MLCKTIKPMLISLVAIGATSAFLGQASADDSYKLETVTESISTKADGPLLITDLPPNQVYSQQQLIQFEQKINSDEQLKGNLNGLEKDYLLYQQLLNIDPDNVTEQQRELIFNSVQHKPGAYRSHEEGPVAMPVYDVRSLAGSKLLEYQVSLQKPEVEDLLNTNVSKFVEKTASDYFSYWAGKSILRKADSLPESVINQLINGYSSNSSYFSHSMLYQVMKMSGKKEAVMAVLEKSELYFQKHNLLQNLSEYVSVQEQEKILREVIVQNNRLSSQALLNYAKLPESVKKTELFYELLSDPKLGSSSAAVLAESLKNGSNHQRIVSMVKSNQGSRDTIANSLLALWLSDTRAAKAALRELLQGEHIPFEDMQAEVELWLN